MNDMRNGSQKIESDTTNINEIIAHENERMIAVSIPAIDLRDYFAAHVQADDRLVKCVRAMDDTALLLFAEHPGIERDEWITETGDLCGANVFAGKSEVEKVVLRLEMEAKAIARVRYMQADAMLAARAGE